MKLTILSFLIFFSFQFFAQPGCTDPYAINFDENASENDGSCNYVETTIDALSLVDPLPFALAEQSGMVQFENHLWVHLDSGNGTKMFKIDATDYSMTGEIELLNIENVDWEDATQDQNYLYIGDFGNNTGNRTDLKIWRIEKSQVLNSNPAEISPEIISFSYPEQTDFSEQTFNHNFDCEAMVVFEESIFLFTKEWQSNATSIYKLPTSPGNYEAQWQGALSTEGLVTGADYDPDNNAVCLTGYSLDFGLSPFVFLLWDFDGQDFTAGNKRKINLNWANHQVESIAFKENGKWYIGNEYFEIGPVAFQNQLREIDLNQFFYVASSIEQYALSEFLIYPNPSNGLINLTGHYQNIKVFNALGEQIKNVSHSVEYLYLNPGIYFFQINNLHGEFRQKVIVHH